FALPGIVVSIPAGMLADRYGQKAIGVVSLVLMIAGAAIFALSDSLPLLGLGRAISGAGAMTLLVVAPQALAQWFADREIGIASGVFNSAVPLGVILSLNLLSVLGEGLGWRASIWASAAVSLVTLGIFVLFFSPAPRRGQPAPRPSEGLFRAIRLAGTPIWLVGAAWMFFNAALVSLFTFTPDFLRSAGSSAAQAGMLTSAVMWPALVLSPLVGYVIDKVGGKRALVAGGGIALSVLLFLVPVAAGWMLALLLLIGVAQAMVPAPIFALPPEVTGPQRLGLAFGIISTCLNLGIVAGPAATGLVRDVTGSYQASYALMAAFAILIALAMLVLGRGQRDQPMLIALFE
ncbi:MAG: MFS transporter, partial [Dehalococcoidia bacterium]|nr:MFS transporter [Dehalococcoidia bacterium]